jgi:hypothetical protein
VSADQTAAIYAQLGDNNNADTQQNVTQYFATVPREDLDTGEPAPVRVSNSFSSRESMRSSGDVFQIQGNRVTWIAPGAPSPPTERIARSVCASLKRCVDIR